MPASPADRAFGPSASDTAALIASCTASPIAVALDRGVAAASGRLHGQPASNWAIRLEKWVFCSKWSRRALGDSSGQQRSFAQSTSH